MKAPGKTSRELRDLAYVLGGHERQTLDLYLPGKPDRSVPLVLWVHGGGYRAGSKWSDLGLPHAPPVALVADGFAVASIGYRLSEHATFPAQIEDCKAAVRWLRAHAAEYGLDQARFGAWGPSAGGHLVSLLGTSGEVKELETLPENAGVSSRVQAVCDWFGVSDFLLLDSHAHASGGNVMHDAADSPISQLFGGPIQERREAVRRANPMTYVSADAPPFLIVHGARDTTVSVLQSKLLHEALRKAGVDSTLDIIPDAGHGGEPGGEVFASPERYEQAREFFIRTLGGDGRRQ